MAAGEDYASFMFHVKHDTGEVVSSVSSPLSGENTRGGVTGGILRYEHIQRIWSYLLLAVKRIDVYVFTTGSGQHRAGLSYI